MALFFIGLATVVLGLGFLIWFFVVANSPTPPATQFLFFWCASSAALIGGGLGFWFARGPDYGWIFIVTTGGLAACIFGLYELSSPWSDIRSLYRRWVKAYQALGTGFDVEDRNGTYRSFTDDACSQYEWPTRLDKARPVYTFKHPPPRVIEAERTRILAAIQECENHHKYREGFLRVCNEIMNYIDDLTPKGSSPFMVPLSSLINPARVAQDIRRIIMTPSNIDLDLFKLYRGVMLNNERERRQGLDLLPREIANLFRIQVPYVITDDQRCEGWWICAASGRGKTTLLSQLLLHDIKTDATIFIFDSKPEFTKKVRTLAALKDRLLIFDPTMHLALNPFLLKRQDENSIARAANRIEALFSDSSSDQMSTLAYNCIYALIAAIPNPSLRTFMELLQVGWGRWRQEIESISNPDVRAFFTNGVFDKFPSATKQALARRLDGLTRVLPIQRIFNSSRAAVDMNDLLESGKVILINNSVEELEEEGAEFYGRYFISLIVGAAQERKQTNRMVYIIMDEAHDVIKNEPKIARIIDQLRSRRIALLCAHQRLAPITNENVRSALAACTIRMANSRTDQSELARMFGVSVQDIDLPPLSFCTSIVGSRTRTLSVDYYDLATEPQMTEEETAQVMRRMEDYCDTYPTDAPLVLKAAEAAAEKDDTWPPTKS